MVSSEEDGSFVFSSFKAREEKSDNNQYQRMIRNPRFLAEILQSDREKVLRFHLVFETEDGEASPAKRNPVLGKAFVRTYAHDSNYERVAARIQVTIDSYKTSLT
mgnify:CR=1 FL=1